MVNLLGRRGDEGGFARFEPQERARIEVRLGVLARIVRHARLGSLERADDALAAELEELDAAPTRLAALALLEAIDGLRWEADSRLTADGLAAAQSADRDATPSGGVFVCHRPGRSLATGEAEIASRGLFDGEDRPPLACWIGVLAGGAPATGESDDFVIVAWLPPGDRERARAGCRACPNGALALLDDVSPPAAEQLRAATAGAAERTDGTSRPQSRGST